MEANALCIIPDQRIWLGNCTDLNRDIVAHVEALDGTSGSLGYYADRRATTTTKAWEDAYLGKKAEFIAAAYLEEYHGFPALAPDLTIYERGQKSWDADLPFSSVDPAFPDVHVKACSRGTYNFCGDYSWTWQWKNGNGNAGTDDLFGGDGGLIVLVFVEKPWSNSGFVKAVMPWSVLRRHLEDPKKSTLHGVKKVVYFRRLESVVSASRNLG